MMEPKELRKKIGAVLLVYPFRECSFIATPKKMGQGRQAREQERQVFCFFVQFRQD
jgi:hypothetical protein